MSDYPERSYLVTRADDGTTDEIRAASFSHSGGAIFFWVTPAHSELVRAYGQGTWLDLVERKPVRDGRG